MKRGKIIKSIADTICHAPFAYNPKWKTLPESAKMNYQRILSILKLWENNGCITLLDDEEYAFILHPEKLPSKEQLIEESKF